VKGSSIEPPNHVSKCFRVEEAEDKSCRSWIKPEWFSSITVRTRSAYKFFCFFLLGIFQIFGGKLFRFFEVFFLSSSSSSSFFSLTFFDL